MSGATEKVLRIAATLHGAGAAEDGEEPVE
jgi:hypothetical protein